MTQYKLEAYKSVLLLKHAIYDKPAPGSGKEDSSKPKPKGLLSKLFWNF